MGKHKEIYYEETKLTEPDILGMQLQMGRNAANALRHRLLDLLDRNRYHDEAITRNHIEEILEELRELELILE